MHGDAPQMLHVNGATAMRRRMISFQSVRMEVPATSAAQRLAARGFPARNISSTVSSELGETRVDLGECGCITAAKPLDICRS
jgi:hypothetical protein